MYKGIKKYKKFPLYSSWGGLLNSVSWQLPAFLLAAFFSTNVVGFYALGFRIIQMPMNLIGSAIGQVFFQRATVAKAEGTLHILLENSFRSLVIISFFPMAMLTIIGQDLYVVLFGANWAEAGVYTQILGIWAFVWFVSSPISSVFAVLNIEDQSLKIQSLIFISRIAALSLGGLLNDARLAIFFFASSGILVYGYYIYEILRHARVPIRMAIKHIMSSIIISFPYLAVCTIAKYFIDSSLYNVLIASVLIVFYIFLQSSTYISMMKSS